MEEFLSFYDFIYRIKSPIIDIVFLSNELVFR